MSDLVRVLLIEDGPGYAMLLRKTLADEGVSPFHLEEVDRLQAGLDRLAKGGIDVVLLDLYLPDSNGLDTFRMLRDRAPEVPIVVLTVMDNDGVAVEAVREGAQDFLVKGQVDGKTLSRVMRYAIERHRMSQVLQSLALVDELTGLYNRRGFLNLADHHRSLSTRTQRTSALVFADVDGLKKINDTFGHSEGDVAIQKTAQVLRETFRTSDIVARIGGDEFAVIAVQADQEHLRTITARLQERLNAYNAQAKKGYELGISVGVVPIDPKSPLTIQELLTQADAALYEHKRLKRRIS